MSMDNEFLAIEHEMQAKGYAVVCGCDEAGAGPLAGAVFAAAVILPEDYDLPFLTDSKKVTPKRREVLFDQIKAQAVAWAIASVDEKEIDEINILNARLKAMDLSIHKLDPLPDFALIDGNRNAGITIPNRTVIKGDSLSASSSAASIHAKVARDRYMMEMAEKYPEYKFEQHKGYGTKLHYEMLHKYGPCPIHRLTFLKNL